MDHDGYGDKRLRVRVQALVLRGETILMAKVHEGGQEWWCLPGGGLEAGETPEEGALRELWEECGVRGKAIFQTAHTALASGDDTITFLVEIGDQEPRLGYDPEALAAGVPQALVDIRWLRLEEITERDRAFLWASGLLSVPKYWSLVERWGDEISYP
jgi:8-oxo-dGTP diphosphatase